MIQKLKSAALMLLAVVLVLLAAYAAGGRAARRSSELQQHKDEQARLRAANEVINDARKKVDSLPAGGAADQLRADWMRKRPG